MKRSWWLRFVVFVLAVGISFFALVPTFFSHDEKSTYPVKSKINLGLDLQGGLYIIMGIDFDKVYKDELRNYVRRLSKALNEESQLGTSLGVITADDPRDPRMMLRVSQENAEKALDYTKRQFSSLRLTAQTAEGLIFALSQTFKNDIEESAVTKSIEVIRNRIDEFGVNEPEIVSQGEDRIVIQLPGVKDIERAKELIGKTAKLEFRLVDDKTDYGTIASWLEKAKEAGIEFKKGDKYSEYLDNLNNFLNKDLPKGHRLFFEKNVSKKTNDVTLGQPYLLQTDVPISGDNIQDAQVQLNSQENTFEVGMEFKPASARVFEELTGNNVGRLMAIVLDGSVQSAPRINQRIGGGRASISMVGGRQETFEQSRDLALVLRAGALPVELEFQEQRVVGPSLGADSIEKSRTAGIIAAALVFIFVLFYYKVAGLIATITLLANVLIVLACLVGLEATLTLPGIAGIALTIGMAVDANIIIYERIKEEVAAGANNLRAVESGFGRAFWTILDANLTTAVAGLFLLNFGTGPIRGFAVTLLIGIAATIYTSYFVGNMLFEFYMDKNGGKKLSV